MKQEFDSGHKSGIIMDKPMKTVGEQQETLTDFQSRVLTPAENSPKFIQRANFDKL